MAEVTNRAIIDVNCIVSMEYDTLTSIMAQFLTAHMSLPTYLCSVNTLVEGQKRRSYHVTSDADGCFLNLIQRNGLQ